MPYRQLQWIVAAALLVLITSGMVFSSVAATTDIQDAQQVATLPPTATFTPEPTFTPSNTPPPPIPGGALTGVVINASVLLVRDQPYLGANVVGRVRLGERYQILGRDPDAEWYRIQLYGVEGWVWGYYMFVDGNEFNAPEQNPYTNFGNPADTAQLVVQSTSTLKLRAQPNVASEQIGRVTWGDYLPVIGRSRVGSWYQVVYKGTVGWVFYPNTKIVEGSPNNVPFVDAEPIQPAAQPNYDIGIGVVVPTRTPAAPQTQYIVITATPQ